MSLSVAGLGWPSIQNGNDESWIIGREPSVTETACTPGMERILSSNWRKRARVSAEVVVEEDGIDKVNVMAWLGLNPGLTRQRADRLRSIRPAPISRTNAMATSIATKLLCKRWRAPLEPRPLSLSISLKFTRELFSAGARPKTIAANSDMAMVKSNTRPSTEISLARGKVPGRVLSTALAPKKVSK